MLTSQERWLVLLVLSALVAGAGVKHWRDAQRAQTAIEALQAESQE